MNNETVRPVRMLGWMLAGIIIFLIVADQVLKIWVKTHFYLGESYEIFPWFQIKFIENNGMAFGMEFMSKFLLTFGRIIAVILLILAVVKLLRTKGLRTGFFISMALIIAGAMGNVFDCVFYGEIFNNPVPPQVAQLFPPGGGYAGWFEGRVVDMLYFPFFSFVWPEWMPWVGGKEFEFFQYIFNLADSAICVGVFMLVLFYSRDIGTAWKVLSEKVEEEAEGEKSKKIDKMVAK